MSNLGYYMWLINLIYFINPLKILNYQSRRYFRNLLWKNFICLFYPMNMNIFLLAIVISSFTQPFNDLTFTICTLKTYDQLYCQ